jgi:hypothetical protein
MPKSFKHGSRTHQKWGVKITLAIMAGKDPLQVIIDDWDKRDFVEFTEAFGIEGQAEIDEWLDDNQEYFQEEYLKLSKPE